jgi:hypothetical protein
MLANNSLERTGDAATNAGEMEVWEAANGAGECDPRPLSSQPLGFENIWD